MCICAFTSPVAFLIFLVNCPRYHIVIKFANDGKFCPLFIVKPEFVNSINFVKLKILWKDLLSQATWFNAHLSCLACGGQLASIESEAENNHVVGLIRDLGLQSQSFWLAGTDLPNEGIFNWFTTGDLITYSNFAPGQPDNRDLSNRTEDCLVLWGEKQLQWNDVYCNNLAYFICENKPSC